MDILTAFTSMYLILEQLMEHPFYFILTDVAQSCVFIHIRYVG